MTTREALAELQKSGHTLTVWHVRGLIDRGEIPRPRLNSSLQWDWTASDLDALKLVARERQEPARA
jgi:hypothetical protein